MEKSGGGLDVTTYNLVKLRGNYKGSFPAMQVVRAEALIEEVNHPGANRWFLESTPIQMLPPGGGICGRLTYDLPLDYLQGGVR